MGKCDNGSLTPIFVINLSAVVRSDCAHWCSPNQLPTAEMRSAVDVKDLTRNCWRVSQEHDRVGNVFDSRYSTHWGEALQRLRGHSLDERSIDNARRDCIHPNVVFGILN